MSQIDKIMQISGDVYKNPEEHEATCKECGATFLSSTSEKSLEILWGHLFREHGYDENSEYAEAFPES